jgi:hypothetical protein
MINRNSRNKFAELLMSLASGQITNDEFEDRLLQEVDLADHALMGIFHNGAWGLYSDTREYRLQDSDALTSEERQYVAKLVLFLKSDYEYEWPVGDRKRSLLHRLSFGRLGKDNRELWDITGDIKYWPFLCEEHFENAKKEFGYLGIKPT